MNTQGLYKALGVIFFEKRISDFFHSTGSGLINLIAYTGRK